MVPEVKNDNSISLAEKKPQTNSYFLVLSSRFRIAKYITICILVVFLLATTILFRDEITIENLRYLIKDFEIGDNINIYSTDTIPYDLDTQVDLELYKGDIVIAASSYFYLCDLQGNKRLSETSTFTNPVVLTSDKYLMVYGLSEYTYTLYNTFSKLHSETFEYPITGAALSDNGMYAIVTRSAEYRSVIYLYDENFKHIGSVYKDKYVIDVEFNHDGSELLITSVYSKNGNYCTEIVNYVPFSENASSSTEVEGSMVFKSGYNSDGGYSIIYDNKIQFYDSEFVLRNTYEYPVGLVPITTEISKEYTIISYSENIVGDNTNVVLFNAGGEIVLSVDIEGQTKQIKSIDGFLYILLDGEICRVNIANGEKKFYKTERNAIELLVVDEKTLMACFSDHTSRISLE